MKNSTGIDNVSLEDLSEIGTFSSENVEWNIASFLLLASAFIKRFRECPNEPTTELMPAHGRWVRAVRRMYERADDPDRAVLSGADYPGLEWKERNQRFTKLCYELAIQAGEIGRTQLLIPSMKGEKSK